MIYHLQPGDQKTQGCDFVSVLKPENQEQRLREKKDVSAQVIKQDGASSFVLYLGSIQALNGLSDAHPHWGGHQFKCKSHPETPSQTYLEIMFNLHTPGQASWHIKLSGIAIDPQTCNLLIMVMISGCLCTLTLSFSCGVLSNLQVQPCCFRYPQPCLFVSQSSAPSQAGWSSFSFPWA